MIKDLFAAMKEVLFHLSVAIIMCSIIVALIYVLGLLSTIGKAIVLTIGCIIYAFIQAYLWKEL